MEVKEKSKKRELIKTIAIIFLAVLLLLTFFSGTIMNYSLPEVATQMVSSGTINAKIRGSGTLAANESYEVMLKQTREVRSVCVKVGDSVEQGDLLFVLGDVESEELKTAQEALENAQINYQKRVLELSKTYADNDLSVKTIREDLEKAMAQRDANKVTDEEISFAKGDLAAAKTALSQTEVILKELNALQADNEDYAKAKEKVTELEGKITTLEASVADYQDQLDKLDDGTTVENDRAVQDARDALENAITNWKSDWTAYQTTIQQLVAEGGLYINVSLNSSGVYTFSSSDQIAIEGKLRSWALLPAAGSTAPGKDEGTGDGTGTGTGTETQVQSANPQTQPENFNNYQKAYSALLADQEDVATKQTAYDRVRQDGSIAEGNAYQQRRAIQDKLNEAQSNLSTAQRDLRSAQQELDNATGANEQVKDQVRAWEATQRQQEASITTLEESLAALQEKQGVYKAAVEQVDAKQRELETALSGKDIDKQLNNLDLQAMSIEIEKQKELVEKYRKDSIDAEITSPVSGVISTINVSAGKETTPDQAMAVIDVVDRGYTIKISVTNEQAKQVRVGDTAEVTNYYWGNEVEAVLEAIASDPASAGQKKLLVFRITGDVEAGQNITLSVGQKSAPMDCIVPKSAIREDSNGKFVFVITSKSTPLGNRYTATRTDVQVLAEDDTSVAVSGLAQNDYVITTSSKPLDAGSQVRMVENP